MDETKRYTISITIDSATDPRGWADSIEHEYFYFDKEMGEKLIKIEVKDEEA